MKINNAFLAELALASVPLAGQTQQHKPEEAKPRAAAATLIDYYGDSTVWGYRSGVGDRVATPAPAVFAKALGAVGSFAVVNEGVNGSTACGLYSGNDGKHPAWALQMEASKAQYVIFNFAINDQWEHTLQQYTHCLMLLARTAKHYGKEVVFETPNPTRDSGPTGLDVYVNAMRSVAAQERLLVIDQYSYLQDMLGGRSALEICPDGVHPGEETYVTKGNFAASVFTNQVLGKQQTLTVSR